MKSIIYIVPYFGKLPKNFQIWLNSCAFNSSINWIVFTNDRDKYLVPENVKMVYMEFDEIRKLIQSKYDFDICLDRPWKLCDFKVAYGDIFADYIKEYDFWGHCDLDLIWGNIRKFINDDILNRYEKIGFQGHSTLYKNIDSVNFRYKTSIAGIPDFKKIFESTKGYAFDEVVICEMYDRMGIAYYKDTNFAHLSKYTPSFNLEYLPTEMDELNKNQVFLFSNEGLFRYSLVKKNIIRQEYMYIHFFCRPMIYKAKNNQNIKYLIYPDKVVDFNKSLDIKIIKKYGHKNKIKYFISSIYVNRKKLTIKKIIFNLKKYIKVNREKR